jgi:hypothetical protein
MGYYYRTIPLETLQEFGMVLASFSRVFFGKRSLIKWMEKIYSKTEIWKDSGGPESRKGAVDISHLNQGIGCYEPFTKESIISLW